MRMGLMACLAALLLAAPAAFAQSKPPETSEQKACTSAATADYNKRELALHQQDKGPLPSVDTNIAMRRLEEDFCLRLIRCVLDDQDTLKFNSAFDACLKYEALDKYDAVPREEKNEDQD